MGREAFVARAMPPMASATADAATKANSKTTAEAKSKTPALKAGGRYKVKSDCIGDCLERLSRLPCGELELHRFCYYVGVLQG